jgi:glucokinase
MQQHLEKPYAIGVDIGGTKINMGIIDDQGKILFKNKLNTQPEKGFEFIMDNIAENLEWMINESGIDEFQIRCAGFGIPGTTDPVKGEVIFAPNLGWRNIPFRELMSNRINLDIYLGQDTQAGSLAEFMFGAGRGCENIVCVTLGTGIGCGIIINRKIYRGSLFSAGELGHIIVELNGRKCNCGRRGCLEVYASGSAVVREARKQIPNYEDYMAKPSTGFTAKDLYDIAARGNDAALQVIEKQVEYIGMGIVNVINILSPDKIIISGGMCKENTLLIKPLQDFVKRSAYGPAAERVEIARADLGEDAPMIGAALFYKDFQSKGREKDTVNGEVISC